jgi:hypothetical protein
VARARVERELALACVGQNADPSRLVRRPQLAACPRLPYEGQTVVAERHRGEHREFVRALEQSLDACWSARFLPDQARQRSAGRAGRHELLNIAPSRWYLMGFLVPEADERSGSVVAGDDLDDELGPRSDSSGAQNSGEHGFCPD